MADWTKNSIWNHLPLVRISVSWQRWKRRTTLFLFLDHSFFSRSIETTRLVRWKTSSNQYTTSSSTEFRSCSRFFINWISRFNQRIDFLFVEESLSNILDEEIEEEEKKPSTTNHHVTSVKPPEKIETNENLNLKLIDDLKRQIKALQVENLDLKAKVSEKKKTHSRCFLFFNHFFEFRSKVNRRRRRIRNRRLNQKKFKN